MSQLLQINHLTKKFGSFTAINDVSLNLEQGKIIGLLGPNGSGKTTLLKLMNGLLTPNEGTLTIKSKEPGVETKKIVSYLPDKNFLPNYMTEKSCLIIMKIFMIISIVKKLRKCFRNLI